jgi:hypothetical protein
MSLQSGRIFHGLNSFLWRCNSSVLKVTISVFCSSHCGQSCFSFDQYQIIISLRSHMNLACCRLLRRAGIDSLLERAGIDSLLERAGIDSLLERAGIHALLERAGIHALLESRSALVVLCHLHKQSNLYIYNRSFVIYY